MKKGIKARITRCTMLPQVEILLGNNRNLFIKLKVVRCRELRCVYLYIPSHYAYTTCQDAPARVKSFLKLKSLVNKVHLEVKSVSTTTICENLSIH